MQLPKKHIIGNMKKDIVESRQIMLETFLDDVLTKPTICQSSELFIFLQPSDNYDELAGGKLTKTPRGSRLKKTKDKSMSAPNTPSDSRKRSSSVSSTVNLNHSDSVLSPSIQSLMGTGNSKPLFVKKDGSGSNLSKLQQNKAGTVRGSDSLPSNPLFPVLPPIPKGGHSLRSKSDSQHPMIPAEFMKERSGTVSSTTPTKEDVSGDNLKAQFAPKTRQDSKGNVNAKPPVSPKGRAGTSKPASPRGRAVSPKGRAGTVNSAPLSSNSAISNEKPPSVSELLAQFNSRSNDAPLRSFGRPPTKGRSESIAGERPPVVKVTHSQSSTSDDLKCKFAPKKPAVPAGRANTLGSSVEKKPSRPPPKPPVDDDDTDKPLVTRTTVVRTVSVDKRTSLKKPRAVPPNPVS